MRILFLAPTVDLTAPFGDATHVREEAANLKRLGHLVTLLVNRSGRQWADAAGCRVVTIRFRRASDMVSSLVWYSVCLLQTLLRALAEAQRNRYDIIYERHVFVDIGPVLSRILQIPSVAEVNGLATQERPEFDSIPARRIRMLERVECESLIRQNGFVCVTNHLAARVRRIVGDQNAPPICVIGNGANVSLFSAPRVPPSVVGLPPGQYIAFSGYLVAWQNLDLLLRAFHKVATTLPNCKLLILGTGPELNRLMRYSEDLGVAQNVVFVGQVPYAEVPKYLSTATVCVALKRNLRSANRTEFSPIKVFEYMAAGCPVVVSDFGELSEAIRSEILGEVVPEDDPDWLAQSLLRFLSDPETAARIGNNAKRWVTRNHSWESVASQVAGFLGSVVGGRSP